MTSPYGKYAEWLLGQIENGRDYEHLIAIMGATEFVWTVPNDDNRLMDGMEVRREFNGARDFPFPCTVLEVMIALSRRMEFTVGGTAPGWAWQFMLNLELDKYKGMLSDRQADEVRDILHALVWRTYQPDGQGGFFPLQDPDEDQTRIEIWYQMSAYIEEILPD